MEFKIKRLIVILFFLLASQFVFSRIPQILKSSDNPVHGNLNLINGIMSADFIYSQLVNSQIF
ncbi:MAG: hypothetical protein PHU81_08400 [Acidobacteriota bacterium]|nr:hypothetical protein [Acidobacteriota bacterium]